MHVKVKKHPIIGVLVASNGMVFARKPGSNNPNNRVWTFGHRNNEKEYFRVVLDGKRYCVHRLVAETFLDNPENKKTVDHILRDRTDNNVCQLQWATWSEQNRNRSCHYASVNTYGVCSADDRSAYNKAYHEAHKKQKSDYHKAYYEAHKEQKKAYNKAWYEQRRANGWKHKRFGNKRVWVKEAA